ncbi:MAG: trypsin-like peptidase domain-containing protein [Acidobacteria bacterium]|nr:trypsin-like peptidase domain-containing protein [Acidobacteriota bacterium]
MRDQFEDLAVIVRTERTIGSGFFVAPNKVLTCAHVVGRVGSTVEIIWRAESKIGHVLHRFDALSEASDFLLPDVAIVQVDLGTHPLAELSSDCRTGDPLYAYGFTPDMPGGESVLGECEGYANPRSDAADLSNLIKIKATQIKRGMSGSPVRNERTQKVCGMLKRTRGDKGDLGGFAIRIPVVIKLLPELQIAAARDLFDGLTNQVPVRNFVAYYLGAGHSPRPFGGRRAELDRLSSWLNNPDGVPYFLIAANAGVGKSALVAHWVSQTAALATEWAVVYYPISARFQTNGEYDVFRSIVGRLSALRSDPPLSLKDAQEAKERFHSLLLKPVQPKSKLLLVLDGVDECCGWSVGSWLLPATPPPHLRVLVTARGQSHEWLRNLGLKQKQAISLALNPLDKVGIADVLVKMGDPLSRLSGSIDIVESLFRLTQGDPLLIGLYIEELLKFVDVPSRLDQVDLNQIDPGLAGYFESYWLPEQRRIWQGKDNFAEARVVRFLGLSCVAFGPIKSRELIAIDPEMFPSAGVVQSVVETLRRFVVGDGRDSGFVFSHPRLGQYFAEEFFNAAYLSNCRSLLLDWCQVALADLVCGQQEPSQTPEYIVKWYVTHLESGDYSLDSLLPLVTRQWYLCWQAVAKAPTGFISDLHRIWRMSSKLGTPALAMLLRIGLFQSSLAASNAKTTFDLFEQCVIHSIIEPPFAAAFARQQRDPILRAKCLIATSRFYHQEHDELLLEALLAVRAVGTDEEKCKILVEVAKHCSAEDTRPLDLAVDIAATLGDAERVSALAALAPRHRPPTSVTLFHAALDVVARACTPTAKAKMLNDIANYPSMFRGVAIDQMLNLVGDLQAQDSTIVFDLIEKAWFFEEQQKKKLLVAISEHADWRSVDAIGLAAARQPAFYLDIDVRAALASLLLRMGETSGLSGLCWWLTLAPSTERQEILAVVRKLSEDMDISEAPIELVDFRLKEADSAQLESIVDSEIEGACKQNYPSFRLYYLLARVVGVLRDRIFAAIVDLSRQQQEPWARAFELRRAFDVAGSKDCDSLAGEIVEAARQCREPEQRVRYLLYTSEIVVAARSKDLLAEAIAELPLCGNAERQAELLLSVASSIKNEALIRQLLAIALDTARLISDEDSRAIFLASLSAYNSDHRNRLLSDAVALARRANKAVSFAAVGSRFEGDDRRVFFAEAISVAAQVLDPFEKAKAMNGVLNTIGTDVSDLVDEILQCAWGIGEDFGLVEVLLRVAEYITLDKLDDFVEVGYKMRSDYNRALMLGGLAYRFQEPKRSQFLMEALAIARAIPSDHNRAYVLSSLIQQFPSSMKSDLVTEAMSAVKGASEIWALPFTARTAAFMDEPTRSQVLRGVLDASKTLHITLKARVHLELINAADAEFIRNHLTDINRGIAELADGSIDLSAIIGRIAARWDEICIGREDSGAKLLIDLLEAISKCDRAHFLIGVEPLLPVIVKLGDNAVTGECETALRDVVTLWP